MRLLVQRSCQSFVTVEKKVVGKIEKGLVLLVGFTYNDGIEEIEELVSKLIHLRIFNDENGVMNKSLLEIKGEVLSISQFTLYADASKGRRPSYVNALPGAEAIHLYEAFNKKLQDFGIPVETGVFGADMQVHIENDGPVTILLESRNKDDKK